MGLWTLYVHAWASVPAMMRTNPSLAWAGVLFLSLPALLAVYVGCYVTWRVRDQLRGGVLAERDAARGGGGGSALLGVLLLAALVVVLLVRGTGG
jgi:hypothetical protein